MGPVGEGLGREGVEAETEGCDGVENIFSPSHSVKGNQAVLPTPQGLWGGLV